MKAIKSAVKKVLAAGTKAEVETREEWLELAAAKLVPFLEKRAGVKPADFRVSVGFPKAKAGRGAQAIGQCWHPSTAADRKAAIFICPTLGDAAEVLRVLLHELIHAATPGEGHKGGFVKAARAVGFKGPWTQTPNSPELAAALEWIRAELPAYPHGALVVPTVSKRPGSRLRLWECECEVKVRVASDDFNARCEDCGGLFERQG